MCARYATMAAFSAASRTRGLRSWNHFGFASPSAGRMGPAASFREVTRSLTGVASAVLIVGESLVVEHARASGLVAPLRTAARRAPEGDKRDDPRSADLPEP